MVSYPAKLFVMHMHCDKSRTADKSAGTGETSTARNCTITQHVKAVWTRQAAMLQDSTITTKEVMVPLRVRFVNIKTVSCQFYCPGNAHNTHCATFLNFKLSN